MNCPLTDIIEVRPLEGYTLFLRFSNGDEGEADIPSIIEFKGVFKQFNDQEYFRKVFVWKEAGTLAWPDGQDIDPMVLWVHATGRSPTLLES